MLIPAEPSTMSMPTFALAQSKDTPSTPRSSLSTITARASTSIAPLRILTMPSMVLSRVLLEVLAYTSCPPRVMGVKDD